jgi:ribA/ribD-fused uncharacterized protein
MAHPRMRTLLEASAQGERVRYLFFWSHRPPRDGGVGPGCLSQWWPSDFQVDGVTYPSAEHYMMAGKARLFGDEAAAEAIRTAADPAEAKALGRRVKGFDQERWAAEREAIVTRGNLAKFTADPALRDFLVGTGDRVLVEASPVDRVWGIGRAADDELAARPEAWRGLNLLGFVLMDIREQLRDSNTLSRGTAR